MVKIFGIALKHKLISSGLLVIAIGGVYYSYTKSGNTGQQIKYVTEVAQKGALVTSVSATGNIAVDQEANIDPTISGTVADLVVKVGDSVEEGDTLFTIINDDLTVSSQKAAVSLQQAKNAVDSAIVSEKQAKEDYHSAKKEDEDDPSSYNAREMQILKDKIDIAQNGIVQAQKSYAATLAEYANQLDEANKRVVKASISGTVNEINIKNGDDLSKLSSGSSRTVPIIIGDLDTLKAEVQVNEVDIPNVQIGQKATMTFDAIGDFTASGKVEKIDALGTVSSGVVTYSVTLSFDSLDSRIKPNMSVTASIIVDSKSDVLSISTSAIKTAGDKNYVEVLSDNGEPKRKIVEIGISNDTKTEINNGLSVGDEVITQSIDVSNSASLTASKSSSSSSSTRRNTGMMGGMMGGGPPQ